MTERVSDEQLALFIEWDLLRGDIQGCLVELQERREQAGQDAARVAELEAELAQVEEFINQRPEYVTALKNTRGGDSTEDYSRWSGHAEARRQLATSLNLTTPHEPGEKATRYGVADG